MEDTQILVLFLENRRRQNEILPSPKVSHLRWLEQKDSWFQALEPQISSMLIKLLIAALRRRHIQISLRHYITIITYYLSFFNPSLYGP